MMGQKIKFHAIQQGLGIKKLKQAGGQHSTSLALRNNFVSFMQQKASAKSPCIALYTYICIYQTCEESGGISPFYQNRIF